jgi:hypothetical protein
LLPSSDVWLSLHWQICHYIFILILAAKVAIQNILNKASSRPMALGSTQPLTEMSTRNLTRGKGRPARRADNINEICEPIV